MKIVQTLKAFHKWSSKNARLFCFHHGPGRLLLFNICFPFFLVPLSKVMFYLSFQNLPTLRPFFCCSFIAGLGCRELEHSGPHFPSVFNKGCDPNKPAERRR